MNTVISSNSSVPSVQPIPLIPTETELVYIRQQFD